MRRTWGGLALCAGLMLVGAPCALAQSKEPKVAAVVNGENIPLDQVEDLLHRDTPPVHPLTQQQKRELFQMALDMLVNDALMRQFLAKTVPTMPAQALSEEMSQLNKALEGKKMTLQKFLAESKQTEEELRQEMLVRLRWRSYIQSRIPDTLVKQYYDTNRPFFDKVLVRASHILLKIPEKATEAQKQELLTKLTAIKSEIDARKITFADAAKKYSECPSADKGGDIGHFPAKFAVAEPFARAAFALKVNEMSGPVETGFGYHLILVTDRTPGEPSNFEEVKDVVRDIYAQEVHLYQNIVDDMRKSAQIQVLVQP